MKKVAFLCAVAALTVSPALAQINAVVNASSNRLEQPVAPGSLVSIYGGFGTIADTVAPGFPLPTTLAGTTVTVNNAAVPLQFVSGRQINIQLPPDLAPGRYPVRVTSPSAQYDGFIRLMSAAPGIAAIAGTGNPPRGAILNEDGVTVNSQNTPAARGSVVILFGTGPGAYQQDVPPTNPNPNAIIRTVSTPQVFIGGVPAEVLFSGRAPNLISGAWQLNVRVPNQTFVRGTVVVQVFMDGVDSNEVTLFVTQ